jgi:hypothetical protein
MEICTLNHNTSKGKGKKGKSKKSKRGKGRGQGQKRSLDEDDTSSLSPSSFSSTPSSTSRSSLPSTTGNADGNLTRLPSSPCRRLQLLPRTNLFFYCHFYGWNFTHRGLTCKKRLQLGNQTKLQADSPTSTNPHDNSSVETRKTIFSFSTCATSESEGTPQFNLYTLTHGRSQHDGTIVHHHNSRPMKLRRGKS